MKKVLVDAYFFKNLGDDLLIKVLVDAFPSISFYAKVNSDYLSFYKKFDNLYVKKTNIKDRIINRLNLTKKKIKAYRKFDGIIDIGGSIFMQTDGVDDIIQPRKDKLASGIPYVIVGSNFGPYSTQKYIENYRTFFKSLFGVSFRDSFSYKLFRGCGNTILAPDMVFNLDTAAVKQLSDDRPYIVISNIDLENRKGLFSERDSYEKKLAMASEYYLKRGFQVKILPFNEYEGDCLSAYRIKKMIDVKFQDDVEVVIYDSIEMYLSLIKGATKMFSTRFHAMILAWLFHIPQLVISYSDKTVNEIHDLYPKQCSMSVDDFINCDNLDFNSLMNTMPQLRLDEIKDRAKGHLNLLNGFLML